MFDILQLWNFLCHKWISLSLSVVSFSTIFRKVYVKNCDIFLPIATYVFISDAQQRKNELRISGNRNMHMQNIYHKICHSFIINL